MITNPHMFPLMSILRNNQICDLNCYRLFSEKEILRLLEMKEKYWDNDPDVLG